MLRMTDKNKILKMKTKSENDESKGIRCDGITGGFVRPQRFFRMIKIRLNGRFGIYDVYSMRMPLDIKFNISESKSIWQERRWSGAEVRGVSCVHHRRPIDRHKKHREWAMRRRRMFSWPKHECRAECELLHICSGRGSFDAGRWRGRRSSCVYFIFIHESELRRATNPTSRRNRNSDIFRCRLPLCWMCEWQTHAFTLPLSRTHMPKANRIEEFMGFRVTNSILYYRYKIDIDFSRS